MRFQGIPANDLWAYVQEAASGARDRRDRPQKFTCANCGHCIDVPRGTNVSELDACPSCGSDQWLGGVFSGHLTFTEGKRRKPDEELKVGEFPSQRLPSPAWKYRLISKPRDLYLEIIINPETLAVYHLKCEALSEHRG
jgi:hypothetical protein